MTSQHVDDGLTYAELAEAAVRFSDNAALNLPDAAFDDQLVARTAAIALSALKPASLGEECLAPIAPPDPISNKNSNRPLT